MNSISLHIVPLLIGSFDTTSVLIVSVMTIAFIISWAANRISILRIRKRVSESKEIYDIRLQPARTDAARVRYRL